MDRKKYEKDLHQISRICGKPLSSSEADFIVRYAEEGKMPMEVMIEAFNVALLRANSNMVIRYAQEMIKQWERAGIVTLDAVRNLDKKSAVVQQKNDAVLTQSVKHDPYYKDFDRNDLKSCPFCGSNKIAVVHQHSGKFQAYYSKVECGMCGASTRALENFECDSPRSVAMKQGRSVSEVIELWNNRV